MTLKPQATHSDQLPSRESAAEASFPAGDSLDLTAFMALVKEAGRFLASFTPPEGFRAEAPAVPQALNPEMVRALGAASLSDFFALALNARPRDFDRRGNRLEKYFPQGPESVKAAVSALEAEIRRLGRGGASPARLAEMKESRANLLRAARIWPRVKAEALDWPRDAKALWQKARRFEELVADLLRAARGSADEREVDFPGREGRERRSLTRAGASLRTEVDSARAVLADGARWADHLEALSADLDNLLALAVDLSQTDRDWLAVTRKLSARLGALEREERRLKDETARVSASLAAILQTVGETEAGLAGRAGGELLERIENVGRGTLALWRSAVERRRELAEVYFNLPPRLGRPVYLEKSFLATALSLGRAQALLEDVRRRLALAGGRLSTTHRLRSEGEGLQERLALPQHRAARLKLARRRLAALARAAEQRASLSETRDELNQVRRLGRDTHREMVRGRSENNRMRKELSAAALEKERLMEQLQAARQGLGEVGLVKARLLKLFQRKSELLGEVEAERRRLAAENDRLKSGRLELRRKRSKLADLYAGQRSELKKLKDESRDNEARRQNLLDERRELESLLDRTRRERDEVEERRRDSEDRLKGSARELAASAAQAASLSAELSRHGEELAEAQRRRLAAAERVSALRRRLDLVAQAHESLLKTMQRQDGRLAEAEAQQAALADKLTRRKKNILRLVAARQELRAELGAARLKLADLESERDELNAKLAEAAETARGKEALAEHLGGQLRALEQRVDNDLMPFIQLLGEALWHSESQLKGARAAAESSLEEYKLAAEVREANLRLKAADREITLTESTEARRRALEDQLFERESELAEAESRLAEGEAKTREAEQEREVLAAHNRELSETVSRLGGRGQKLRSALGLMKERYGGRLEEARLAEADLRGLLASQEKALEEQRAQLGRLEPFIDHFFSAAAQALPSAEAAGDRALADYLKGENRALLATGAASSPALEAQLAARLEKLAPMVGFLAKAFVANVAELSQARSGRENVLAQLEDVRNQLRFPRAALAEDLERATEEREDLANQLAQAGSTRAVLESSLQHRESELRELRGEAFGLAQDREELQKSLAEKTEEVAALKAELAQADRDLAENDGRLEASWAALNYLGTRAGDRLGAMQNRLDSQARQVDTLSLELKRRDSRVKELEDRQDQLALLYWTMISKTLAAGPGAALSLPAPADFQPEAGSLPGNEAEDQAPGSGGLGKGLLDGVRKVARRSLFTLIMAGGLVMVNSFPAVAAPPALPGPSFAPGASMAPRLALPAPAGEVLRLPAPAQTPAPALLETPLQVSFYLDSTCLGRTVGLELVDIHHRLAGRPVVEKRLAEIVDELAASQGLTNSEFLRLMRAAKKPESTVHLPDFEGRSGGLTLLEAHFPKLTRQLENWPGSVLTSRRLCALLKSAADFKPLEGGFWERLFFDFLVARSPEAALAALLDHLQQKGAASGTRPEYAGRLAPLTELENMGPESFIKFMAGHIKNGWPNREGRIRDLAAQRPAGDIYFSARLFALPVTLLAAVAHQRAEDGEDFFRRGATCALHTLAADLAALTRESGLLWQEGRPPLCDLDEALAEREGPAYIEEVYRKKMALVMAYNKTMNAGNSLLPDLRRSGLSRRRAS